MKAVFAAAALAVLCQPGRAGTVSCAGQPEVAPSGRTVPVNLLRIDLRFAAPLRAPLDMARVKLLDAGGQEVVGAFLDLPLESADGMHAALLLHPGRVKSGVAANLAVGRSLQEGTSMTLVVDDPQLGRPMRKTWRVVAAQTRPPDPGRWTLRAPSSGNRSVLVVDLDAPLSSAAAKLIAVRAPDGQRVPGDARLLRGETRWSFVPAQPWQPGRHALVTHPELEDAAGNRTCSRFEAPGSSRAECAHGAQREFSVEARPQPRTPSVHPPTLKGLSCSASLPWVSFTPRSA